MAQKNVHTRNLRTKLQYAYSIVVFSGVLVTAYLLMSRETNGRIAASTYPTPQARTEGSLLDPGMSSLFEAETALTKLKKDGPDAEIDRLPTQIVPKLRLKK